MATAVQVATFIDLLAPYATEQMIKHGGRLFASVCIAQAAHETGWGAGSPTMMRYNAPFGIKVGKAAYHFGSAWHGESYNSKTKEYYGGSSSPTVISDNFRAYRSLSDATEDYMDMLCTASRYRSALSCKTPEESIRALAPSYATGESLNNAYSRAIISIIEKYGLKKFDGSPAYKAITPDLILDVIKGSYGNGMARQEALTRAGYNYPDVRAKINELNKLGQAHFKDIKSRAGDYADCVLQLMSLM